MDASHQRLFEEQQKVAAIKERIAKMEEARDNAQKAHDDLFTVKTRYEKKLAKTEPSIWSLVRNAPFLDFTAPTMKVTQVVVNDLHNDVNFMEIPRIDRCVTCHVGINKPGFEDAPNPYKTHPSSSSSWAASRPTPTSSSDARPATWGRTARRASSRRSTGPTTTSRRSAGCTTTAGTRPTTGTSRCCRATTSRPRAASATRTRSASRRARKSTGPRR